MIDISQLTSLVSAFRVETEKESISPETVGKLLQDIVDLLATASTDAERQILDDWKTMLSQYVVVYDVAHATGMVDMEHMFLTLKGRSLRNGATFTSSVPLSAATDMQAGVMSASHVQAIMSLQASLPQVRSAVTALQSTAQQHGWQLAAIQAAGYVVTDIRQGTGHASKINLSLTKHDVRTGEDFAGLGTCSIAAANTSQAGAMTVAHVTSLANAKTDISTLQAKMRTVQGAGTVVDGASVCLIDTNRIGIQLFGYNLATGEREIELQQFFLSAASQYGAGVMTAAHCKQLEALRQAVFGSDGYTVQKTYFPLAIEINRGIEALRLHGALALVRQGYTPYLFRYSRKRNRRKINGIKDHGELRKGWNVVGDCDTITFGPLEEVKISKKVLPHENLELDEFEEYQWEARFFVNEATDINSGRPYVPYGKSRVELMRKNEQGNFVNRKVRLLYGLAFANQKARKRQRLLAQNLVTPIVPFHVSNAITAEGFEWIFER